MRVSESEFFCLGVKGGEPSQGEYTGVWWGESLGDGVVFDVGIWLSTS